MCAPSLHRLQKKLGQIGRVQNYRYCSLCMAQVPLHLKRCSKTMCKQKKSKLCYFSILPFDERLADIFSGKLYDTNIGDDIIIKYFPVENWDTINYPFTRSVTDTIQDVQDGIKYRELMQPGEFLSVPEHAGLVLCSDGVPLFKSSGIIEIIAAINVGAKFYVAIHTLFQTQSVASCEPLIRDPPIKGHSMSGSCLPLQTSGGYMESMAVSNTSDTQTYMQRVEYLCS